MMPTMRMPRGALRDERGLTTAGMVLSMLVALSLVFTSAQVYRVNVAGARIQGVADAAALAAANQVAEFMLVVRVCDAVALTISLTSLAVTGIGVVALCVPLAAPVGQKLLDAGRTLAHARDTFAEKAKAGLERLGRLLPFLSAANAASVAAANDDGSSSYLAMALLVPAAGEPLSTPGGESLSAAQDAAEQQAAGIQSAAADAERAAQQASEAKRRAFEHDCGAAPSYCMYERAQTLAGLSGADNPLFGSVDAWSFSVALDRAKAYYPARLAQEAPDGPGVEAAARSALRTRFYEYASSEVARGYVRESAGSFEARFPRLPRNTDEMRATSLYTEAAYPVTANDDGVPTMHAWPGCPNAAGADALGSIAQMDREAYVTCEQCGFAPSSMGKVAAASSSIENGFEYHYDIVAQAAEEYEAARAELDPLTRRVKDEVSGALDRIRTAAGSAANARIDALPPGRQGVIAVAANVGGDTAGEGFASPFVPDAGPIGPRVAVSAATLLAEPAGEGGNVVSSFLDGLGPDSGAAVGAAGAVLECWGRMLEAYADGQAALDDALERGLEGIPLAGESGLGPWAAQALRGALGAAGIAPANLDALKPVLVNSAYVAQKDDGPIGARLLSAKESAASGGGLGDLFSSLLAGGTPEGSADAAAPSVTIARIELLGPGGPSIPVEIALPSAARGTGGALGAIVEGLRRLVPGGSGVTTWR